MADSAHIILNECKAVKVWFDLSGSGTVRQGSWGVAGSGSDRYVMARQLRFGWVRLGWVRRGEARYGSAVKVGLGQAWLGQLRLGTAVMVR